MVKSFSEKITEGFRDIQIDSIYNMSVLDLVLKFGEVGVIAFALYIIWKLTGNHMTHNTEATNKLTIVIERLNEFLREHMSKK